VSDIRLYITPRDIAPMYQLHQKVPRIWRLKVDD